ncbi:MAG: glycoside hydrolase family 140 protein, partial [Planctomycetota bacterium]
TAWELFHRLDREEADRYLADRASKRFTVIQAVALAELDGLNTPNRYGHTPLVDDDPARPAVVEGPRNDYWDHVDYIVDKAESLGLYLGMLPTWGDKWNLKWGVGPEVFTPENAEAYGRWLGARYKTKPIIWILGGDRPLEKPKHFAIVRAMAQGIEAGDGGRNLMTFHPAGGRNSATLLHQDEWLDFNMIQSGHERPAAPTYQFMTENLALAPRKPTLDGEPCYEDHPVKGDVWNRRHRPGAFLPWFDEWDVRRPAYESMLAGACGHTYGNHNLWQMWLPGREPVSIARTAWPDALDHPGALQMKYLRGLFEARPFWKMVADQSLVAGPASAEARAARESDGGFALVYLPVGGHVTVDTQNLSGDQLTVHWFNPRQNSAQLIGTFATAASLDFEAPSAGRNNDWVLVLDDAGGKHVRLGTSYPNFTPTPDE